MSDLFVDADAYDRFMGRFSSLLAAPFVEFAGVGSPGGLAPAVAAPARVLDVGCGTGMLTRELVARGLTVAAVDPSEPLVSAVRASLPGVDARVAGAQRLPFADGVFDGALAQLVVNFLPDPAAGVREMARVTRPGGVLAANVWDFAGGRGPLGVFEQARRETDPSAATEEQAAGAAEGYLASLFTAAGLADVRTAALTVSRTFASFDEWWTPFTLGVGPAGAYVASLSPAARASLRGRAESLAGPGPFTVEAVAWAVAGTVRA
ncbi:class I SAM-dependent methyltransferase [Frondihabitans australicus]|nr:class I SAM-dependent methyltransferase [Frondihabitans australicus]